MLESENPLPPCSFVIFGATGNLASNKLIPALYRLELADKLPEALSFIAFARREWDDAELRNHVRSIIEARFKVKDERLERFCARFDYQRGELNDPEAYLRLKETLAKPKMGVCSNVVFYLAIKPGDFPAVIKNLQYWSSNSNEGFALAYSTHNFNGTKKFSHEHMNGFTIQS